MSKLREIIKKLIQEEMKPLKEEPADSTWFDQVDFQPLTDMICKCIGLKVNLQYKRDGKKVSIICPNLVSKAGIFKACIKEVTITAFNNLADDEKQLVWIGANLSYSSKSGGTNGMEIVSGSYKVEDGHWNFRLADGTFKKG